MTSNHAYSYTHHPPGRGGGGGGEVGSSQQQDPLYEVIGDAAKAVAQEGQEDCESVKVPHQTAREEVAYEHTCPV